MDINKLITRSVNLITDATSEWQVISSEKKSTGKINSNYLIPYLIAVSVSVFLGDLVFNSFHSFTYKILNSGISFAGTIASIYISAYIINQLSKSFHSEKDKNAVHALIVYGATPWYISNIITGLVPFLFFFGLFSFFSIFIIWKGLFPIMKTPFEKKISFIILIFIVLLGVNFCIFSLLKLLLVPFSIIPISI
jgi:hypothetical protein